MNRRVDIEMQELRRDLLHMASLAETSIGNAIRALVVRDRTLTDEVLSSEDEINRLEVAVDERCLRILALHAPEAGDLRFIGMALKTSNDLERLGDQAVNIVERVLELLKEPPLKPLIDIPRMTEMVQRMLKDALDAFVQGDVELARDVCRRDDEVDALDDQLSHELTDYMMRDPKNITRAVNLMFISRHLERVADHATNIAEEVIYVVQGKNIKHHAAEAGS
jgi:phosphate transport system protein